MANPKSTHATHTARHNAREGARGSDARRRFTPFVIIAGLGMVLTAYLIYESGRHGTLAFCAAGSGCDTVQSSRYSVLLGVPLAAWGFAAFVGLAFAAWMRSRAALWFIACAGAGVSIYLTVIGLVDLGASCVWCLASLALWLAATALAWRCAGVLPGTSRLTSAGLAAVGVLVLHLHYAGIFDPAAGPEDPYARAVAEALKAGGAKFYGASWCPHCEDQKTLFGTAARHLPYVECAPNGPRAPQATECVAADIKGYPTWIIHGNRYRRMLSVEQLGKMAGVPPPAAP